jgi:hypothetical protein
MCPVRSYGAPTPMPLLDPAVAAREYLRAAPDAERHQDALIELARVAWSGEFPVLFYYQLGLLLSRLPWLVDHWVGAEVVEAVRVFRPYDPDTRRSWVVSDPEWRERSAFTQMEGLLLLARLHAPGEVAAQKQLARVLDTVEAGLLSDRGGTAKRARRRHPLKDTFHGIGRPQTMEALAASLAGVIGKVAALYPRVGAFLQATYFPLVCGRPFSWLPSEDSHGLLGVDEDPESGAASTTPLPPFDIPLPTLRPFTADDLADEMSVLIPSLDNQRAAMLALSPLWRGEQSWDFFKSIHRLSHTLKWLRPVLSERVDLEALRSIGQAIHRTQLRFAIPKVIAWRQRNHIAPMDRLSSPRELIAPSGGNPRWGILQLRGLLLLGRHRWGRDQNPTSGEPLSQWIRKLDTGLTAITERDAVTHQDWNKLPIEAVLDRIGQPGSTNGLIAALERALPEISEADAQAGILLREEYLPLLTGKFASPTPSRGRATKRRRRASTVRRTRIRIPTRERPLEGESPEEAEPGQDAYRRTEPSKEPASVKEEIRWVHQRIWGSNPLLVRNHIESLCDAEATLLVRVIDARVRACVDAARFEDARISVVAALTLLTGQGPKTFAAADSRLSHRDEANRRPRLLLEDGQFELPVIRPESAFEASVSTAHLLEETGVALRLALPPTICAWIKMLLVVNDEPWRWQPDALRGALTACIDGLETEISSGITLARVRNFARARLREATKDTSKTMILCGDSFGLSTAPLYYASVGRRELEDSFRAAMWPVFGDKPHSPSRGDQKHIRVGSQLLITPATARDLARSPSAPMHAPGRSQLENRRLIQDHNVLTNHTLCMLIAAGGHRPTMAIFELGRFDFDTEQPAAIFRDKQCDPAHFFRYTPIADLISEQIAHYVGHLRSLAGLLADNLPVSQRATLSLHGDAPLFFHLAPSEAPVELSMTSWRETLPTNWNLLPLNWGRTWLASRGREAGIEADHIAIVLGHLEATGFPFSRESPLEPAQLSREVSRSLGLLARSAGWVLRKGLSTTANASAILLEAGPLKDWKRERQTLADESRKFQIERRQILRSQLRKNRDEGERIVRSVLNAYLSRGIPTFEELAGPVSSQASPDVEIEKPDHAVVLSLEDLEAVQGKIEDATSGDKVLSIAAHNALHRYLKRATKRLRWQCPIPSPWLAAPTMEPTPFFPGLFRATTQIRALREHFGRIAAKSPDSEGFSEFEWGCGIAMIALCIFSFESDSDRVRSILRERVSATGSSAFEDLLLVETGDRPQAVGVRGLAAVAIARLKRDHPTEALPDLGRLDEVLAAQIPEALSGSPAGLLARLCATVGVSNLVELSGLARLANDTKAGCVSMLVPRQRQFLEEGYGPVESGPPEPVTQGSTSTIESRKCAPSAARTQYMQLRRALYIGAGPKTFKLTGESLSQANIGAFRFPLERELEAFISQDDISPLVACVAAFALRRTSRGTPEKKDPAWNTVYGYITSFGAELVELGSTFDFPNMDADEYLDLYQDVLDRKSTDHTKAIAAREMAGFHAYLLEHHDFEVVDFSDLEGVVMSPEHQVDAEVIQPQEFLRGLEQLSALASPSKNEESCDPARTRLDRQAHVFAILLRVAGARHNELTALRFKDVLARPECTVLFVRPSRYRRLKTSAARRVIDCSKRLSPHQRRVVSDWIAAEKSRLGKAWKSTLPVFGQSDEPKLRVASEELRDTTLEALGTYIGSRSKVHRVRHLVASEDLAAIWLADKDWRVLRRARARARRLARGQHRVAVVLPRHIREQGIRFGHRQSSTTVMNYFHMPWMTLSRAHAALQRYVDRHSAAVALGVTVAAADKIVQRRKSASEGYPPSDPMPSWIARVAGTPTATPGAAVKPVQVRHRADLKPISARLMDRVLRNIQKGLPITQAGLTHGLSGEQLDHLMGIMAAVKRRTAFTFFPRAERKQQPRTARSFQSARSLERILELLDEGSDEERELVQSLSACYMLWASKSKRDELIWPTCDVDRLARLLSELGVLETQIIRAEITGEVGFEQLVVLRQREKKTTLNHAIAWVLTVAHATASMRKRDRYT